MRSRGGALERVEHDQQLHQVVVHRRARGLDHEDVLAADVLVDLDVNLSVGEARDIGVAQRHLERLGDLLGERTVRVPREELQLISHRSPLRALRAPCPVPLPRPSCLVPSKNHPRSTCDSMLILSGWGGRTRTSEYGIQSPAPCQLGHAPMNHPTYLTDACPALRSYCPHRPAHPAHASPDGARVVVRARDPEHGGPAPRHHRSQRARREERRLHSRDRRRHRLDHRLQIVREGRRHLPRAPTPQRRHHPPRPRRLRRPARRHPPVHVLGGQREIRIHQHQREPPVTGSGARRSPRPVASARPLPRKNGTSMPSRSASPCESLHGPPEAPQPIERPQRGGGVARSPAQSRRDRDLLVEPYPAPPRSPPPLHAGAAPPA